MIEIALSNSQNYVSLKRLLSSQNISYKFSEQIVRSLCKDGLLKSERGSRGGYMLTKPPSHYTIGEILRTTEDNFVSLNEFEVGSLQGRSAYDSVTFNFFRGLNEVINQYINSVTLYDLAQTYQNQAANDYII